MLSASVEISRESLTCFQCVEQAMLMGGTTKTSPLTQQEKI